MATADIEAQWARLSQWGSRFSGPESPEDAAILRAGLAVARDGGLRLSDFGVAVRARIENSEAVWEDACLAGLGPDEAATLARLLAKVRAPD